MVTLEQLTALPLHHRATITTDHLDLMGHMNIRHYMSLFDNASWHMFNSLGMTSDYYREQQAGGFALEQHIRYLAEVRLGETVAIRIRLLGRTAKRIHFMAFMVNETTDKLAATLEGLGSHADMRIRRTAPYPPHIAANIDALLSQHQQLTWDAPVCGVIKP
jgi:acyl-CoA thioester hydrolase